MNTHLGLVGILISLPLWLSAAPLGEVKLPTLTDTQKVVHSVAPGTTAVIMEVGSKCPTVRRSLPLIQLVAEEYQAKGVQFFLLNSSAHDTVESAMAEAKLYGVELPVIMDSDQNLARLLGLRSTAQIVVIRDGLVQYRGALDDSINYEGRRPVKKAYLKDALDAVIAGKEPTVKEARTFGCMIT